MEIWILQMNDMRDDRIEIMSTIAWAHTHLELLDLVRSESVDLYVDEVNGCHWSKTFRKGGPLEWYNIPRAFSHGGGARRIFPIEGVPSVIELGDK